MHLELLSKEGRNLTLAIHWPRFGPYHTSRLERTSQGLAEKGIRVVGIEIAVEDTTYEWRVTNSLPGIERYVACPTGKYGNLSPYNIFRNTWRLLQSIQPDIVAITGYSTWDAIVILSWCRIYHRPAILMMASKYDDASRTGYKESLKRFMVRQYVSALCSGTLQKQYLEMLGMHPNAVYLGYDVVDNNYFHLKSSIVRQNPENYRHLPGLAFPEPFFLASARFIPRKNIVGLILAYMSYREQASKNHDIPWRLVILGDGIERNNIEKLISTKNIEGITLAGFRQIDELPAYYGLASVFIHPPLQEQWGLVVNEAMASGLPVVVSKTCGCVPDLLIDSVNGFTFDPTDLNSLTQLMMKCTDHSINLPEMAKASLVQISHWGLEGFVGGMYCAVISALGPGYKAPT